MRGTGGGIAAKSDVIARLLERAQTLKARHVFPFVVPLAVAVLATLIALLGVARLSFLTTANDFLSDYEVASLTPAEPADPGIVIVAINEKTLQLFPYRAPIDRKFISDLLLKLESDGVRAIGLDYLFDQPTEQSKDDLLHDTITQLKAPLVVSFTSNAKVETQTEQSNFLDTFVPSRLRGVANLAEDRFDVVRWIFPGEGQKDGSYLLGFPRALAAKLGVKTPDSLSPIAWRGQPDLAQPASAFHEYPAHTVSFLPAAWFKDKIVLIGSDVTLTDRHRTPFTTIYSEGEGVFPGVVIQAYALSQLLHGREAPAVNFGINLAIALGFAVLGALLGIGGVSLWLRVGAGVFAIVVLWAGGLALFHYGDVLIGLIAPTLSLALAFWAMEALSGREARQQREFIRGAFSRYVSPKVVDRLIHDPSKMSLEGERRVMTYVFTDIADFTTMSELLESKELARLLNSYLDGITEIILKTEGMVDKYIGDAVFAIFNAPVDLADHAERAVKCALEVDRFTEAFRIKENAGGIPLGITRIGVHTGPAVIGNFGSRNRFTYTAEGDAVNVASRLEGINKHIGTRICVSEATRALCPNIRFRPIGSIVLKGKTKPIDVWEPLGEGREDAFFARYGEAFAKLKAQAPEALELFTALHAEEPEDPCVTLHLNRLRHGAHGDAIVMKEK